MTQKRNRVTGLVVGAAALTLIACGGTQTGVTDGIGAEDGRGNTAASNNPCADSSKVNPCAVVGLGKAADATVLASDGSHVQLASTWLHTNAVIVFYRGHW